MRYFLAETIIITDQINAGQMKYQSSNIIPMKKTPFRIYIGFIEQDAFLGHKHKNPFDFRRHWLPKKNDNVGTAATAAGTQRGFVRPPTDELPEEDYSDDDSDISIITGGEEEDEEDDGDVEMELPTPAVLAKMNKKSLVDKVLELASLLDFKNVVASTSRDTTPAPVLAGTALGCSSRQSNSGSITGSSGSVKRARCEAVAGAAGSPPIKQRGKGPGKPKNATAASTTRGMRAMSSCMAGEKIIRRTQRNVGNPTFKTGLDPDLMDKSKDYCFITNIELAMNGQAKTQLNGASSRLHCPKDFIRFMEAQNNFRTNQTDGITYDQYNSNFYFSAFDLSTSVVPGDANNMLKTVASLDQIRVDVEFSQPLPRNLTMVVVCNCSSAMVLQHGAPPRLTYVNTVN
jgi:hypothetical protein